MLLVCYKTTKQTSSPTATYWIDELVLFLDGQLKYIDHRAELFVICMLKHHTTFPETPPCFNILVLKLEYSGWTRQKHGCWCPGSLHRQFTEPGNILFLHFLYMISTWLQGLSSDPVIK